MGEKCPDCGNEGEYKKTITVSDAFTAGTMGGGGAHIEKEIWYCEECDKEWRI